MATQIAEWHLPTELQKNEKVIEDYLGTGDIENGRNQRATKDTAGAQHWRWPMAPSIHPVSAWTLQCGRRYAFR